MTRKKGPRRRRKRVTKQERVVKPRHNRWKVWKHFVGNYQRMCKGKFKHETEERAEEHISSLRALGDISPNLSSYLCLYCEKYHVGHARNIAKKAGKSSKGGTNGGAPPVERKNPDWDDSRDYWIPQERTGEDRMAGKNERDDEE